MQLLNSNVFTYNLVFKTLATTQFLALTMSNRIETAARTAKASGKKAAGLVFQH